ncbi:MAG: NAD-binding protein, partial [Myxococcota bacterium]|nr:NAD-binding protein [Myxococcota bacterium]
MRTVICGMGEVGRQLARELAENGWDVVGVDNSSVAFQEVEDALDVLMLRGDAALPATLEKAGAGDAALV